uniref:CBS domain-containing protein CBSCBSPB3 isoform X2 n=1 Tax=Rhizophora mucronata TaxID=61149 RepID=A0A2P2KKI0_RHIMU
MSFRDQEMDKSTCQALSHLMYSMLTFH